MLTMGDGKWDNGNWGDGNWDDGKWNGGNCMVELEEWF